MVIPTLDITVSHICTILTYSVMHIFHPAWHTVREKRRDRAFAGSGVFVLSVYGPLFNAAGAFCCTILKHICFFVVAFVIRCLVSPDLGLTC